MCYSVNPLGWLLFVVMDCFNARRIARPGDFVVAYFGYFAGLWRYWQLVLRAVRIQIMKLVFEPIIWN